MTDELPKVILKSRRALPFFARHPWVFAGAIDRVENSPADGDEVALFSQQGDFIARGLYNSASNIRVRLYTWNPDEPLDRSFWASRIESAIRLRKKLEPTSGDETACRLIYSESDGLSGLVVDRYGRWLVAQFTSRALADRRGLFVELLRQTMEPAGIWLRTEKGTGESEGLMVSDGLLDGRPPPRPLFIEEHGLRYGVDVIEGQKTGFYLDQRENRAAVARYLAGARVLDLFCYSGAFGLAALKLGRAREVLGVDSSQGAIRLAQANAERNGLAGQVRFEHSDVFQSMQRLKEEGQRFDAVLLDPPKMARRRAGVKKALRAYYSLNRLAVDLLDPGGILVTCSCSGLVGRDDFERMILDVALRAERTIRILEIRGQAPDHPISPYCTETAYLKCYICAVE